MSSNKIVMLQDHYSLEITLIEIMDNEYMPKKFAINLTKEQENSFLMGYEKLWFKNKSEVITLFKSDYNEVLKEPHPPNPEMKNYTKEEVFIYVYVLSGSKDILPLSFYQAYTNNKPEDVLNGLYTKNHLFSVKKHKYSDSVGILDLLLCYSGNNIKLAEYYLDVFFTDSNPSHQLWDVMPFALKALSDKRLNKASLVLIEKYLSKKNGLFEIALVTSLKAILIGDMELFSECLHNLVKLHPKSKWLHDFSNPINKFVPYLAYSVYAIAYFHLDSAVFEEIKTPKHKLWWNELEELNRRNNFKEGNQFIKFDEELSFLNKKIY